MRNKASDPAHTTSLGKLFSRIDNQYKERIFVAIQDGNFYIELIILIGSSLITLILVSLKKSEKGRLSIPKTIL